MVGRCPVTGGGELPRSGGVFNELPNPGAARRRALRAECNHPPPI